MGGGQRLGYGSTLPPSGRMLNDTLLGRHLSGVRNLSEGTVLKILDLARAQILELKAEASYWLTKPKLHDIWDPSSEGRL